MQRGVEMKKEDTNSDRRAKIVETDSEKKVGRGGDRGSHGEVKEWEVR